MERLKHSKMYPHIRKCLVGLIIALIGVMCFTVGASADQILVGNVTAEVFDYVSGTETSINDMIITHDLIYTTMETDANGVLVWASNPSVVRTFDGVTAAEKVWTATTDDIDGIQLEYTLHQYVTSTRKGLRLAVRLIGAPVEEWNLNGYTRTATIRGDNGGTIQITCNILANATESLLLSNGTLYETAYNDGYKRGQLNPTANIRDAIYQSGKRVGYVEGTNSTSETAYNRGYTDGLKDGSDIIDESGLSTPNGAMSIVITPLNAMYRVAQSFFTGLYDNPIGAVLVALLGLVVVVFVILKIVGVIF